MSEHFKVVCTDCGTVMNQCRCPSKDKVVRNDMCSACLKKLKEKHIEEKVQQ